MPEEKSTVGRHHDNTENDETCSTWDISHLRECKRRKEWTEDIYMIASQIGANSSDDPIVPVVMR